MRTGATSGSADSACEAGRHFSSSAALHVQQVHHALSGTTFGALNWFPGWSVPARFAQSTHDALTHGVYAAMRQGCGALLSWVGQAEQMMVAAIPGMPLVSKEHLHDETRSDVDEARLAGMGFHFNGRSLRLASRTAATLKNRVTIFIHGLGCDEQSWQVDSGHWTDRSVPRHEALHYGALLARDFGVSPLYLRYNASSGLAKNGRHLSALLSRLVELAPQVDEVVLIGHSLGGLVAQSACSQAEEDCVEWVRRTPMVICLGTPHGGVPLGRARESRVHSQSGNTVTLASPIPRASDFPEAPHAPRALRLIAGNLADDAAGHLLGQLWGDGLVSVRHPSEAWLAGDDMQQVELAGLGHMTLLNHPRVYAVMHAWLQTGFAKKAPASSSP